MVVLSFLLLVRNRVFCACGTQLKTLHRLRQHSANRLVIADVVSALVNTVSERGIIHADPVQNLTTGLVYYSVPRRTTKNQGETKHDNRPDSADNTPSRVRSRTVVVAEMTSTMVENNQVTLSQASLTPCPKIWDRISRQPSFDSTQSINDGSVLAGLYKSYQLEVLDSTEKNLEFTIAISKSFRALCGPESDKENLTTATRDDKSCVRGYRR
jgi:hypothetical protein